MIEAEYLRRRKQMEEQELKQLRNKVEKTSANFSLWSDFFKIVRGKAILAMLLVVTVYGGYQFYTLIDFAYDPFENKKRLVYLKYADEINIANSISKLMIQSYSPINIKSQTIDKLSKMLEEIKNKEEIKSLNLRINSDITVLDVPDNIFLVLPNGNIFISLPLLNIVNDKEKFMTLAAMEICHNYLRTNAYNIHLDDLQTLWGLRSKNFNIGRVGSVGEFNTLRRISFLPIWNQEHETRMINLLPEIVERMGHGPKEPVSVLKKVLTEIEDLDRAIYSSDKKPKLESILAKHPVLLKALEKNIQA